MTDTTGIEILVPVEGDAEDILSEEALAFVANLHRTFDSRRQELLARRTEVQAKLDEGWRPDFLEETAEVRQGDWTVAPIPADLERRVVEITGPVDRKMIINALNSGADVFMADFEDSNSPTWDNVVDGQVNLRDAVAGTIAFHDERKGKDYALGEETAVLMVRPRGWHLSEKHVTVDGAPISASLFDFGLYMFHNAKALLDNDTGPYFYLPKLESHLEARLWNDVFNEAQDQLGVPRGSVRATVLVETILAVFEMDEILYELKDHSAGLNSGRWDYIFSFIKKFARFPDRVLPDRDQVGMTRHFLNSYCQLLIETCHRRHIHGMGGMAAQIPIKADPEANEKALAKVRNDKLREVNLGHDGTWVAHPGLVKIARDAFESVMGEAPNQLARHPGYEVSAEDLLKMPRGTITEAGLRHNVNVGLLYLEAWLRGSGCVPIYHLMEDAATAEICRTQIWQWLKHGATLDDGRTVDTNLFETIVAEELDKIESLVGEDNFKAGKFGEATRLFSDMVLADDFVEFLTLPAYDHITSV